MADRRGREQGEGAREKRSEEEALRVRETPCVGTSGWHSASCLQSVILTPFPYKQISMREKYIMTEASTCYSASELPSKHNFLGISNKGEMENQEGQNPFFVLHVAPASPTPG